MNPASIGALLGGIGQAAGGLKGLFGGGDSSSRDQWEMFNQNVQNQDRYWMQNANLQREFAQNSIQWRAADAKAAGIHPIFAMGAGGAAASPTAYVPGDIQPSRGGPDVGYSLAQMGQGVGRAIAATQSKEERVDDMLRTLQIQQASANVELTKMQTASIIAKMAQAGPGMPGGPRIIDGQGDVPGVKVEPHEVSSRVGTTGHQPGVDAYVSWQRHGGVLVSQPPKNSKAEDELGAPLMMEWLLRNRAAPMVASALGGGQMNDAAAPPKQIWAREFPGAKGVRWDPLRFGWIPIY